MSKMIGKISKKAWSTAPSGATHVTKFGTFYKYEYAVCYVYGARGEYWSESENGSRWLKDNLISKEEDLGMSNVIKSVADLPEGTLVIAVDGDKGFIKSGRIVWMSNANSHFSYYKGFLHLRNGNLSIVSYSEGG